MGLYQKNRLMGETSYRTNTFLFGVANCYKQKVGCCPHTLAVVNFCGFDVFFFARSKHASSYMFMAKGRVFARGASPS